MSETDEEFVEPPTSSPSQPLENRKMSETTPDITIPPEALEATAKKIGHHRFGKQWSLLTLYEQDLCRTEARTALQAGIKAWPGMSIAPIPRFRPYKEAETLLHVILPLHQDSPND